jgi:hypothetical protein
LTGAPVSLRVAASAAENALPARAGRGLVVTLTTDSTSVVFTS